MLCDHHTHTPLCKHAEGDPVEYARAAQQAGLAGIGISDHNPMPEAYDDWRMAIGELPRYFEMVEEARQALAPFPVRLGLECDYLPDFDDWIRELTAMAQWDYLIGAVHYIAPGWDVDNPRWASRWTEHPVEYIWSLYWAALEKCIRSGLFDIIAHPDLPKKFGHRPEGDLRRFYEPCIQAAASMNVAFEINTAGLHKDCAELYPAMDFLRMARSADIPLVISSDAHQPGHVGRDFEAARVAARAAGYEKVSWFAGRERHETPL